MSEAHFWHPRTPRTAYAPNITAARRRDWRGSVYSDLPLLNHFTFSEEYFWENLRTRLIQYILKNRSYLNLILRQFFRPLSRFFVFRYGSFFVLLLIILDFIKKVDLFHRFPKNAQPPVWVNFFFLMMSKLSTILLKIQFL